MKWISFSSDVLYYYIILKKNVHVYIYVWGFSGIEPKLRKNQYSMEMHPGILRLF